MLLGGARVAAFRGITAPASLKAEIRGARASRALPFRGITAPASLKESLVGGGMATDKALSGALLPRPH